MQVLILIEPRREGGFRASAGDPFHISAEADSEKDAAQELEAKLRSRLKGSRVAVLEIGNGSTQDLDLQFQPVAGEDWFFETMRDAIDENRKLENEASG
jgi:hypothetical protein